MKENEKQAIEEMAEIIARHTHEDCERIPFNNIRMIVDNVCEANVPSCGSCKAARALTKAGYRKQEWISVDERLPKDGETVLTISSEEEIAVCFYETELEGVFQQCHGLVTIYNITHWMPLPEPPKMKGGAE